jgi:hypothetical protein
MQENRRFQRVNYLSTGRLHHNDAIYNCRIDNISKNGALLLLKKTPSVMLSSGDSCYLLVCQADKELHYQKFEARIVRFESDVVALEFTELKHESQSILDILIQKELHFLDGGKKLIDMVLEVAASRGIGLTVACFDKGELNPEIEMHTLRLSAGEHTINVHLHREEIEAFNVQSDAEQTNAKICHAIERLKV